MKKIRRIYFVGIKGVGMTALSLIAKEAGFMVQGSDVSEEFITDPILKRAGIVIDKGFKPEILENFIKDVYSESLVITTAAHGGLANPQSAYAKEKGVVVLTHGQALGLFMKGGIVGKKFIGISVLGCHGKTTIAAMCATAFSKLNLDPTYAVGTSEIFPLGNPGHFGKGKYFISEADEYISDMNYDRTVKFLYQNPQFAIINNIDFDHPDVYSDLNDVKLTFEKFCRENINHSGTLIANGDDQNVKGLIQSLSSQRPDLRVVTYGQDKTNNIYLENFYEENWESSFEIVQNGKNLGKFSLRVPGLHNAKNALSVAAILLELGFKIKDVQQALWEYKGGKRRQEYVGETQNGAIVVDDYAHHPDEIDKTLQAVKNAYRERKIVCVFQPHTLSRTKSLWQDFANSFSSANEVIFLPIFTSKREGEADYSDLYKSIKELMKKNGTVAKFFEDTRSSKDKDFPPFFYEKNRIFVIKYIHSHFDSSQWVIVTLGAGDLYRISYDLIKK
ncbi:MAG: UDP-N-acetylmuramate--L-alanine ligase [Candidatus Levybacteria bacterium]|nr:UDP-N-acetylmuramate--L-alanine ligase [Candidatus Levybacteria bacterium]